MTLWIAYAMQRRIVIWSVNNELENYRKKGSYRNLRPHVDELRKTAINISRIV
jgi:hypothetical protein